ncbi:MAG TPA: glycosyltransferase family 4 protein [Candidatus Binataceae bacterium]|nr:glycosyltransferase family 4 protein [Candidatus Binataceae bacterium]
MRIALILEDFGAIGGIQEVVDNLAVEFARAGHTTTIISTPHVTAGCAREPRSTAERFLVELPGQKALTLRHPERLWRQPRVPALAEYLARWRPAIVNSHVWTWDKLLTVAREVRRSGIPFVQTLHDSWGRGTLGNKALTMLGNADALTAVSAATREFFCRQSPAARSTVVIRNGVDLEAAGAAAPASFARPYIFCTAQLNLRFKAVDILIDGFALLAQRLGDVDLVLAGDGVDRARLEQQAERRGIGQRVRFCGVVPRDRLWQLYKGARVFAMPSREPEGLGMVFLEALACGTPAIGTGSGGTPEVIADGVTGFLLRRNDPEELAARLEQLLTDAELRARMGRAGQETVARAFGWRAIAAQYLRVYESCLEGRAASPRAAGMVAR